MLVVELQEEAKPVGMMPRPPLSRSYLGEDSPAGRSPGRAFVFEVPAMCKTGKNLWAESMKEDEWRERWNGKGWGFE